MLKGIFVLRSDAFSGVYGQVQAEIRQLVQIDLPPQTPVTIKQTPEVLRDIDLLFTGWGGPHLDEAFLQAAPNLQAVFYGGGTVYPIVTPEFWERSIPITSAASANAVPVAEYTLSQILFCLKGGWHNALSIKRAGKYPTRQHFSGNYGSTVGLISLGLIGQRVCELLQNFDLNVIAYDPFVDPELARKFNVELCALDEIFRRADVVSLHTPWLPETEGMITGEHFASMKSNAAFINTARGAVVRESEMIAILEQRPDLIAVLDVTYPEPPVAGSPLYTLPNVVLTPHIAGALGPETRRLGETMLEELRRYLRGEALRWRVSPTQARTRSS
jgi:phosphoglycerate dehydrogenase-like enzyme